MIQTQTRRSTVTSSLPTYSLRLLLNGGNGGWMTLFYLESWRSRFDHRHFTTVNIQDIIRWPHCMVNIADQKKIFRRYNNRLLVYFSVFLHTIQTGTNWLVRYDRHDQTCAGPKTNGFMPFELRRLRFDLIFHYKVLTFFGPHVRNTYHASFHLLALYIFILNTFIHYEA